MFTKRTEEVKSYNYAQYLADRQRRGRWHPCFRDYIASGAFSHREANLLLHAMCVGKARAAEDGWVPLTARFVCDGLGLSAEAQAKVIRSLERKRVIEVSYQGTMRLIRIDVDEIEKRIRAKGRAVA
jgi:hypothetical protein